MPRVRSKQLDEADVHMDNEDIEAAGASTHGIDHGGEEWEDPSALDAPPPRDGYVQLWVRTEIGGQPDAKNIGTTFRKGWKPRPVSTIPDGFSAPTVKHSVYGDCIGIEGMILCEMPKALHAKMQAVYDARTQTLVDSVNQTKFAEEKAGRPIHKFRKTTVSKRPDIATE